MNKAEIEAFARENRKQPQTLSNQLNLKAVDWAETDLQCIDLAFLDLTCADLNKANLSRSYLLEISLKSACLFEANLEEVNLVYANLSAASLYKANLKYAKLGFANLNSADLKEADFSGANLEGVTWEGCNMTNAVFSDTTILPNRMTWKDYYSKFLPEFLTVTGKTIKQILDSNCWNCHSWSNCPMHQVFGIENIRNAPILYLTQTQEFVKYFDNYLLDFWPSWVKENGLL